MPQGGVARPLQEGVQARYFHPDETVPYLERIEPAISYAFAPPNCTSVPGTDEYPCRAEWEGTWNVAQPGTYTVMAEVRQGEVQASLDNQPLQGPVTLEAGPHVVRVVARLKRVDQNGVRLRWPGAEAQHPTLVPFASFEAAAKPQ